jgi:hypothetical protein
MVFMPLEIPRYFGYKRGSVLCQNRTLAYNELSILARHGCVRNSAHIDSVVTLCREGDVGDYRSG